MKIALIAAIAKNNAIGYDNKLLYWLPNDLKRFKELTNGKTIIMGSNTFRSLPKGALPNRRNIVLSKKETKLPNVEVFSSLESALNTCNDNETIFIIGGGKLYNYAIEIADILYITKVENIPEKSDAYFPVISKNIWKPISIETCKKDDKHQYDYTFITYKNVNKNN